MLRAFLTILVLASLSTPGFLPQTSNFPSPGSWGEENILKVAPLPYKKATQIAPVIEAKSALALDLGSHTILYQKNSGEKLSIGSITKLMTAILILEEEDLESLVTVSQNAASVQGMNIWLFPGERMTVKNLLYGLLVASGNDAALALAEFNAGTEENFVKKMNQKAKLLNLKNTHFANASGFDHPENYSSAYDLALLSTYALKNNFLREAVSLSSFEIRGTDGTLHKLENTNKLLGDFLDIKGLKTGLTPLAGECLIALSKHPDGPEILTVILGSINRFKETKILLDWIYRSYVW